MKFLNIAQNSVTTNEQRVVNFTLRIIQIESGNEQEFFISARKKNFSLKTFSIKFNVAKYFLKKKKSFSISKNLEWKKDVWRDQDKRNIDFHYKKCLHVKKNLYSRWIENESNDQRDENSYENFLPKNFLLIFFSTLKWG